MKRTPWPPYYRRYRVDRLHWREIGQIARLEKTVFVEPLPVNRIRRYYFSQKCGYLVVKDGPTVIAYFGFEIYGAYAHVLANVTHPEYRRQGLATFVLQAAQPWAKSLGAKAFVGEVRRSNLAQLDVLHAIGWTDATMIPAFFANGEDAHIVMKVFP
jgi:ribosomal-protein-alanine N-acetyltransferase